MSFMPISLNLKDKPVVIIGGGNIAERKVIKIVSHGAKLTVVSPQLSEKLAELVENQSVQWIQSVYKKVYLDQAFLIIAATNDPEVNLSVYQDRKPNQLITIVDQPELSDFHMVSTLQRGKLTISVSTEGASPMLAKKIVNQLSEEYGQEYEDYVEFLRESRRQIIENIRDKKVCRQFLTELIADDVIYHSEREIWFKNRMQQYIDMQHEQ
ncbi:precorrin-2 dehydrogenase/sirohydrochlorin ferrochelatase family protein [Alkalihalobacterium chitinilyticum]|uniref:precorrin-2 dehydrogenase n=1 Tax=Alkalihalobacterium chitinilyticum TaxID=2980103 RepID=A0ABT5VA58_9BACI|nr:NAD(P)-dependent oxidoreductase [Alkalihalobacterium chitinilyticum]MDE5412170.1 siroheme synthase [Alkalihalobacterium chitinilyticum]